MRLLLLLLLLAPATAFAVEPPSAAPPDVAEPRAIVPHIGLALGGGSGTVTIEGATNRSLGIFAMVRAGTAISSRLALDVNAEILTVHENYSFPPVERVGALRLTHVYLAATVFPFEDGLYLRAGAGPAWLSATNGFDAPGTSLSASGFALVGGVGYRLWLGEAPAGITFDLEGFHHGYGGGAGVDAVVLAVGFDWYFRTAGWRSGR